MPIFVYAAAGTFTGCTLFFILQWLILTMVEVVKARRVKKFANESLDIIWAEMMKEKKETRHGNQHSEGLEMRRSSDDDGSTPPIL